MSYYRYTRKVKELCTEIEAKLQAAGFQILPEDEFTTTKSQEKRSVTKDIYNQWVVRNALYKGFSIKDPPTSYILALWTLWLERSNDSIRSIQTVCNILKSNYAVSCPPETAEGGRVTEIYIDREENPFQFPDIRDVMAFMWTFEKKLDELHPPRGNKDGRTIWNRQSLRGNCNWSWDESDISDLDRILACKSLDSLIDLTRHADIWGSTTYNEFEFRVRKWFWWIPKIRFEQEDPTLDTERIESWLNVCFGIVDFTIGKNDAAASFPNFIRSYLDDGLYNVFDLLNDIGIHDQATYYKKGVADRKGEKTEAVTDLTENFGHALSLDEDC